MYITLKEAFLKAAPFTALGLVLIGGLVMAHFDTLLGVPVPADEKVLAASATRTPVQPQAGLVEVKAAPQAEGTVPLETKPAASIEVKPAPVAEAKTAVAVEVKSSPKIEGKPDIPTQENSVAPSGNKIVASSGKSQEKIWKDISSAITNLNELVGVDLFLEVKREQKGQMEVRLNKTYWERVQYQTRVDLKTDISDLWHLYATQYGNVESSVVYFVDDDSDKVIDIFSRVE